MGLFGNKKETGPSVDLVSIPKTIEPAKEKPGVDETVRNTITEYRKSWVPIGIAEAADRYFALIENAGQMKVKDHAKIATHNSMALALLEPVIIHFRLFKWDVRQDYWDEWHSIARQRGEFSISKMQYTYNKLCHKYGRMLWGDEDKSQVPEFATEDVPGGPINGLLQHHSVMGNAGQLKNIEGIVNYFPLLKDNLEENVEQAKHDLTLAKRIRKHVRENPGAVQSSLKKDLGLEDGRRASALCQMMENRGLLKRKKDGKSYQLFVNEKGTVD
jgi:hypothetical protein